MSAQTSVNSRSSRGHFTLTSSSTLLNLCPTQPLVTNIYTADPAAHVFNGRLYIYPSHDIESGILENDNGDHFDMRDYHVLSMGSIDGEVTDHGVVLDLKDIPWAGRPTDLPQSPILAFPGAEGGGAQPPHRLLIGATRQPAGGVGASVGAGVSVAAAHCCSVTFEPCATAPAPVTW